VTLVEAASILELTPRRLRVLIHESIIPARKVGRRWLIEASELQELLTPEARDFLSHPLEKDDLTEDERAYPEDGWREHLAGQTTSLNDYRRKHQHEAVKR
jgi:excisionase family DNA binding protein